MIIDLFRIFSVIILSIVVLIRDIPFKILFKDPYMQVYLATLCLAVLIFIDNIAGFVITLALLVIYFRIYNTEIIEKKKVRIEIEKIKYEIKKELNNNTENVKKKCENDICKLDNHAKKNVIRDINKLEDKEGYGPFISQEHLHAAQNNIYDDNNYHNREIGDTSGEFTKQHLYKSQGLNDGNNHLGGYDYNCGYYGDLNYDQLV
tara:strand:- start:4526 stop:5140 length:615 start_codon:yes stop_codon:yes gene_type:complete